jgi:uncharacterized protein (DUF1330 family)
MHYVIASGDGAASAVLQQRSVKCIADGEMLVLEGPWALGATALGYSEADAPPAPLAAAGASLNVYAVEGFAAPGDGGAFVIAAHKMLDPAGFKPYAVAIPDMLAQFGVRSLARGGTVTPLAGSFAPDRGVVLEFASVEAVLDFYMSEAYAPLLDLRLRMTDPRFVVVARYGTIAPETRSKADAFLRSRGR